MGLRTKHFLMVFASLLILVALAILDPASHMVSLEFSAEPGFYEEPFYLELRSDLNYEIHYTLDGSDPTLDSPLYEGPILITDISPRENKFACRNDISTGFCTDLFTRVSEMHPDFIQFSPNYAIPDYPVDKCTVVRAAAFWGNTQINSLTGSYFVGFGTKDVYHGMKLVSLTTDPENFFGYENGIYVTGMQHDRLKHLVGEETISEELLDLVQAFVGNRRIENLNLLYWATWPANYWLAGIQGERQANIEVYGADRELQLCSDCGIRIQGGASRAYAQKGLNCFARPKYCGKKTFSSTLFPDGKEPHKLTLTAGGNDDIFKLRDAMISTLTKNLSFATMDYTPCALFLDGEFWGIYYITESYGAKYIENHYGVQQDDVIMVKAGTLEDGEPSDIDLYDQMVRYISENDMAISENYQNALDQIDLESYSEYYATEVYIARCGDWPVSNEAAWRTRSKNCSGSFNPYQDGKWRWMLFDVNWGGLTLDLVQADTLALTRQNSSMFDSLCRNPEFQRLFAEKLRYLAKEVFTEEACASYLNSYLEEMTEPLCASSRRFYGVEHREEILRNAQDMAAFFRERADYVDTMIVQNFGDGV